MDADRPVRVASFRYRMGDARHDQEIADHLSWSNIEQQDVRRSIQDGGETLREFLWNLEKESWYRSFFVNGDPVADVVYFKLLDYRDF